MLPIVTREVLFYYNSTYSVGLVGLDVGKCLKVRQDITADVRQACLYQCAVRKTRKEPTLKSDSWDSGSKKCKGWYGGACGGAL